MDLYNYMLRGELPHIRLKDGDTILVEAFGMSVAAYGLLRQPARYEFRGAASGKDLLNYALPMNGVSHVSVGGMRNGEPFNVYVTLHDFRSLQLADGDRVEFVADTRGRTIMVAASGAIHGASRFPVLKQTRLKTLLEYIAVEPELADIKSVYIRRRTVAATGKPVNIKKGQFLAPWEMENVLHKARATGNERICLCERGTSFGYGSLVVDMRGLEIMKRFGAPVVFDATHSVQLPGALGDRSGGQREFVPVLARAAVAVGVAGLFMEVHLDPDKAPCDGPNMLALRSLPPLLKQLREFDRLAKETAEARA